MWFFFPWLLGLLNTLKASHDQAQSQHVGVFTGHGCGGGGESDSGVIKVSVYSSHPVSIILIKYKSYHSGIYQTDDLILIQNFIWDLV